MRSEQRKTFPPNYRVEIQLNTAGTSRNCEMCMKLHENVKKISYVSDLLAAFFLKN